MTDSLNRRGTLLAGCALAASLACGAAQAQQDFPNRNVTLMVGYAAGGAIDQSARLVGQALAAKWGQSVVIENRAGANGTIAAAAVAAAKPDGYTLLVTATSHTLNKFVVKGLRYDVEKAFVPIALTVDVPNVLVVNANSPYKNVNELVTALRAKKKEFTYASQGVGGIPHLAGEMFKLRTGTEMVHVPYKGAAQGMTDLVGGVVDMSFPSPGSITAFVSGGKLRPLAVSSNQRFPYLKDVPTFAEAGISDFVIGTWHGVLAPAGTPPAIVAKINADINAIIQTREFQEALVAQGNVAAKPVTPAQFATKMSSELKAFEAVAAKIDLSAN
ncbi:Bug family tripartite tricarboxylate transporter substrate binding protein [Hydrogenophaga sp. BPS33]|uniref:Bug family tripartite tricarboxylate transporter substrate binding protein n=1 Tax=Hydrogenophaga sp. BPS33 TaxID=2651974 RepID=UPI00131FBBE0|nr:tripartite tricarboxylate transporter substrate binding protein [Hydrogenophaga sp. BPS33]QHE86474.1 tripartite tricarboxylate transporter substrate binding protein [Hydrogenophaga sp. BPS33]